MNAMRTVPFLWVSDLAASIRYYVDGLGFAIAQQWVDGGRLRWCRIERAGAALMLQELWKDGPHANVPNGRVGLGVSIYFICEDALAIHREISARGVRPAAPPFVGNRMWVVPLSDPDGYSLHFESPTDAAEDTVYQEGDAGD